MAPDALNNYRQLLKKVDDKFDAVLAAHREAMACKRGCHSCCRPGLTVSPIERLSLRRFIDETPGKRQELIALEAADPHRGERCRFLAADGSCEVFDARPIVCRSHGAPLRITLDYQKAARRLDVCPLNFAGSSLESLPAGDVIDLDTLNTILALINKQLAGNGALTRTPLQLSAILASDESADVRETAP